MTCKKALIVKFGQIGDVIMAVPAAHALHQRGFTLDWACGRAARPLLECYSWINVIPADDGAMLTGSALRRARGIAAFWGKIAFRRYDLCATLYYDRRYRLVTLPVRAGHRLALSRASRSTELIPGRHHTDEFVRVVLEMEDGCRDRSTSPVRPDRLPPSPLPAKASARRVALVPGGTSNILRQQTLRRWPIELQVALAELLLARGWEVVLVGGAEDAWVRPHFKELAVVDCLGTLSLPQVVSVYDSCDAVVSHDTGPLHLAGLSDVPLVGIFGPTDPATRIPRRPFSVGLWGGQGFACRPCYDGTDFAPCQLNGCMHQVTPEMVLRELDRLLSARSQGMSSPWRIAFPFENSFS